MHEIHYTNKSPVSKQIVVPISIIEGGKENLFSKHQQYHKIQPSLSNNDDDDFMPKKLKFSQSASSSGSVSHDKIGVYLGMSNNNTNINSCIKKNSKLDQHLCEIVKDKEIVRNFNYNSSSDESFENDEYELEKEVTELRKLPHRQKCVNINDVTTKGKFFINNLENVCIVFYIYKSYIYCLIRLYCGFNLFPVIYIIIVGFDCLNAQKYVVILCVSYPHYTYLYLFFSYIVMTHQCSI